MRKDMYSIPFIHGWQEIKECRIECLRLGELAVALAVEAVGEKKESKKTNERTKTIND